MSANGTAPRTDYLNDHPPLKEPRESEADEILDAAELAARWKLTKAGVYRLTRTGALDDVVLRLGSRVRYPLDRIRAFEANGGTSAE